MRARCITVKLQQEASEGWCSPRGRGRGLRGRVTALRAGEDRAPKTQRWLCRVVTERCLDCTAAWLDAETRRRRPHVLLHTPAKSCDQHPDASARHNDGVTWLLKSLLFHAHRWVGVSRLLRGSPSTASNSGRTPPACVHDSDSRAALSGVDASYFVLQACSEKLTAMRATSLISTVF